MLDSQVGLLAIVEYALTEIPADKILLGFELYARDWLLPHVKGQVLLLIRI